jgi:hypothetical protein
MAEWPHSGDMTLAGALPHRFEPENPLDSKGNLAAANEMKQHAKKEPASLAATWC